MPTSVAESAYETVFALAEECRQCYQCGQCVGACPSGFDLEQGPRRIVRLILAGEVDALLEAEDVWRCSECRACTDACPMEVPVSDMMAAVRALQRAHGGVRCAERAAADVADKRLAGSPRIDNMAFGVGMAARGYVPKDVVGAAGAAAKIVKGMLDRGEAAGRRGRGARRHAALRGLRAAPGPRGARADPQGRPRPRTAARRSRRSRLLRPSHPRPGGGQVRQRRTGRHRLPGLRPGPARIGADHHAALAGSGGARRKERSHAACGAARLRALRRAA